MLQQNLASKNNKLLLYEGNYICYLINFQSRQLELLQLIDSVLLLSRILLHKRRTTGYVVHNSMINSKPVNIKF